MNLKALENYLMNWNNTLSLMKDHRKRVTERNQTRQSNRGIGGRPQSQTPQNINNMENQSQQCNQDNSPSTRGGFRQEEGEEDPRVFKIMTQEIHTFIADTTEGVIILKLAQKPRRTNKNLARESHDVHCLHSTKSI
jgi:hypothetical protein